MPEDPKGLTEGRCVAVLRLRREQATSPVQAKVITRLTEDSETTGTVMTTIVRAKPQYRS